jgi:hypothetical protein
MWIPVTGLLAWSVVAYAAAVVVGRLLLVRETIIDRLANRALLWSIVGLLLYRCTMTPTMASLANQLALGSIVMVTSYLYGIAQSVAADSAPNTGWRGQRVYCLIAVAATAAILVAGTSARDEGRLADLTLNWQGIVIGYAFGIPLTINTFAFFGIGVRELRGGDLPAREVGMCLALGAGITYAWLTEAVSIAQTSTGWPALGAQLPRIESAFTLCVAYYATLIAVPLVISLITRAGLDRAGRTCRRLRPLWRDLTEAVPEIVLSPTTGIPPTPMRACFG